MKRNSLLSTTMRCLPPISAHCTTLGVLGWEMAGERVGRLVVVVVGVEHVEIDDLCASALAHARDRMRSCPERGTAELARVVAQRLGRELEVARDLVAHQALGEVRAQLVDVDRRAVVGLHDRVDAAAEIVVGQSDHGATNARAACSSSAASTSAGYTFDPPARIMSVWRSARYT